MSAGVVAAGSGVVKFRKADAHRAGNGAARAARRARARAGRACAADCTTCGLRSYPRRRCYRPIEVAKPADAASLAPSLAPATLAAPTTQDAPQPTHGTRRKTAAYIAGGVGIAGVALGTVTGILVLGKKSTVNSGCSSGACNDAGLSAANSGKNLALVSDVGFGVGIVGLAILLLSGNAESEPAPQSAWQPVLSSTSDGLNAGLFRRW